MSVNIKQNDGSLKAIAGQAESVEIIDNLTTEDSDKALSAKQGKILKDLIDEGGGTSFEVGNELKLENDILSYKANFGTTSEFETFKQDESVPIGATYHVTDDYVDGGGEIYDDTERVIGTWFGKPLYRKVFETTKSYSLPYNNYTAITDVVVPGWKDLINVRLLVMGSTGQYTQWDGLFILNADSLLVFNLRNTTATFGIGTKIIVEYTKVGD